MINALDISTSALVAQRIRMDAVSGNLANLQSMVRDDNGDMQPYAARYTILETDSSLGTAQGAAGVKVASIEQEKVEPLYRYQPNHPYAIKSGPKEGYVAYPNINMTAEFVDALTATRAYEANVGVLEMTKSLGQQTLRILG